MLGAGYDGIILKGEAERPSYIEIADGTVSLKNASDLWGMNTEQVQKQFEPH